jgi:hypothetical protein
MMKDEVPTGYSVAASSHWYNRPDIGITIHRSDSDRSITQFHVWKMRYSWVGKEGQEDLYYDVPTGRFSDTPFPFPQPKIVYSAYTPGSSSIPEIEEVPVMRRVPF